MMKEYEPSKTLDCQICNIILPTKKAFTFHIIKQHNMSIEDYVVKFCYNNIIPTCPICHNKTLYVKGKYMFRSFCKNHANESRSKWSKQNQTFNYSWKKGLTKKDHPGIHTQSEKIKGEKNPSYGKTISKEHREKMVNGIKEKWKISEKEFNSRKEIILKDKNIEIISKYENYKNNKSYLTVKCNKCKHLQQKNLWYLQTKDCACEKCKIDYSQSENEISTWINLININLEKNVRTLIYPKELDIYLPQKNIAIEYNGLYWHSELYKEKKYHSNKTKACKEKNIQLIHIFSDEWENKKEIVQSIILNKLKLNTERVYARKCEFKEINVNTSKSFFNKNHISGHVNAKKSFGLYYNNNLVCAISFRKPFHKKYNKYIEIARFASSLQTTVIGGFSKLMKHIEKWIIKEGYKGILTYADLRFGTGEVYKFNGFKLIGKTPLDYWYTNGINRYNRFKFRAKNNKTEKQISEENKVYKIYGCGSNIYIKEL